jgi:hypothetical protein
MTQTVNITGAHFLKDAIDRAAKDAAKIIQDAVLKSMEGQGAVAIAGEAVNAESVTVTRMSGLEPFRYLGATTWRCPECRRANSLAIRCNALDPLPVTCPCGNNYVLVFP